MIKQLIKYKDPDFRLAEIFQALEIKFSFVKEQGNSFEQITMPGKCRDFLGDVLWSKHTKKSVSIWGFKYDHKDTPYDEDFLKLSLTFPDGTSLENFRENLKYVNEKDIGAGVEALTKVYETNKKDTLIVIASPHWQQSPWKLSLYTFYLKVASYKSIDHLQNPECNYIGSLTTKKEGILLSNVKRVSNFFHATLDGNHDDAGFLATINGQNGIESKLMFGGK